MTHKLRLRDVPAGLALIVVASAAPVLPQLQPAQDCVPGGELVPMPETASEYAEMCREHVGIVPTVDCGTGVRVPVRVDGVEVFEDPGYGRCDTPDFKGNCQVGSRVGRVQGRDADGNPLEDVVWAWLCRSAGRKSFEQGVVSVQLIGHNRTTGASCFFESPDAVGDLVQAEYLHFDDQGLLAGAMPGPDSEEFDRAFIPPPPGVQCSRCHQNNVFLHDPWIDSARLPSDPSEPVLPQWVDPEAPYWVVGGADWDLRTVHIEGNACLDCHRAPTRTAKLLEEQHPANSFMPPRRPGSLKADYAALIACHDAGPANTPGCDWIVPPGGGCAGGIVSDAGATASGKVEVETGECLVQCAAKLVSGDECEKACAELSNELPKTDQGVPVASAMTAAQQPRHG